MIPPLIKHLLIPFIIAMFLAVNMGGSGTGPSFSAAYGANIIRKSLIPGLFGMMVFLGAIIAGNSTASTVGKEILDPALMSPVLVSIILFSVSVSLLLANIAGIPQSTSQSTVTAVVAPAIYFGALESGKLFREIIPAWFVLPVISFILSYLIGLYIYRPMKKNKSTLSLVQDVGLNPVWDYVILLMSLYVAFSIGSNNVANASGPIASMTINELNISGEKDFFLIMVISTLLIAPGFAIGSYAFGKKILKNTGKEIVLFGKVDAVIIAFVSASLLLFASISKGIPSSLVQLNVAAIMGIGVARLGARNIFKKIEVKSFFIMWLIAPLISFTLTLLLTFLADKMGYL